MPSQGVQQTTLPAGTSRYLHAASWIATQISLEVVVLHGTRLPHKLALRLWRCTSPGTLSPFGSVPSSRRPAAHPPLPLRLTSRPVTTRVGQGRGLGDTSKGAGGFPVQPLFYDLFVAYLCPTRHGGKLIVSRFVFHF